ncbi:lacto-N-biosidase [Bifidobacterium samirii]|uniref:FIVAR domain-containing protein n=1 Tax=Bifidobacterium samirii TaxID=2306974 RepID=A0A430FWS8_9BIFI|nr:Rib/alpha-like domain-containing protein [Bifidobacterium samirii]RSX58743.1 FIVAR domain-containing protein [Bifidobacterium samirii]
MTTGKSRGIALLAALGTALAFAAPAATAAAEETPPSSGTTYYVSAANGDDANDGTSQSSPWKTLDKVNGIASDLQPGDAVLLEYGSLFSDQYLHIADVSGTPEAPIRIGAYGDEGQGRPVIAANGVKGSQWHQDYRANVGNHRTHGTVSTTLLLKDVSYITVADLEITNDDPDVYDPIDTWQWTDQADADGTSLDRAADRMDRTGVAGIAENGTTMSHITLDNLDIHDVDGNLYDKHMANGGIYFMAHLPRERSGAADDAWLKEHVSRFDHITIRNSTVKDVDRWGIAVGYTAYLNYIDRSTRWQNDFDYGDGTIDDALIAKYGATNVLIENNTVVGAGGDAITVMYCDRPVIQHNVGDRVSKHINTADYTANVLNNTGNAGVGYGRVAAGIWPWRCKDPVFQYNEMYANLNAEHGNGDGQAWDADYGDGTLYQYNYSYGNSFAALMICNQKAVNTTFRYNISQNDRRGVFDLPSNGPGNHIYNNTAYIDADGQVLTDRSNSQALFENNIFINATGEKKTETWNRGSYNGGQTYDNNLYVNYANTPASDRHALTADDAAAVLRDAGSAPAAPQADGAAYARDGQTTAFDGYRPADDSPAVNAGKTITDLNDYAVEHDFLGAAIKGRPDLGAVESPVASASMESSRLETGVRDGTQVIYATFTDHNPMTVAELTGKVTAGNGTDVTVLRDGTALAAGDPIAEGDILRFSVDGVAETDDYTVVRRISWDWVADYEHGVQDFDWKAVQRAGDGDWTEVAAWDTTGWANWKIAGKDFPIGIENPTQGDVAPADRTSIHGLLCNGPDGYTGAIAWQAPRSGTITLSFKDDEPARRATGGTVKVSVEHDGDVLQTAALTDRTRPAGWQATQRIVVREGDWIRISAVAEGAVGNGSLRISPTIAYEDVEPPAGAEADRYDVAYEAVDAAVDAEASATPVFTVSGAAADAPAGDVFSLASGDGLSVDGATGKVTFTPDASQYGAVVSGRVRVAYADGSADETDVTFRVAASHAQRYAVLYRSVTADAGTRVVSAAPRVTLKADGAAAALPDGTMFSLGDGAPDGATIDPATGVVTFDAGLKAATFTIPVKVTYPGSNGVTDTSVGVTVRRPATLGSSELETATVDGVQVVYASFAADAPMSVAELLAKVSAQPADAIKAVYRGDAALADGEQVREGDLLRFSAAGSSVADTYEIRAKNAWDWVDDFAVRVQGPVWHGQRQTADGGAWSNIADFDGTYPNWMYETYYGPGVDYATHDLPADRTGIHGLISDSPASAGGAAMAWQAPRDGKVTVAIREGEPYLRQDGNRNGSLVLALTHGDETLCSAALSESKAVSDEFASCVAGLGAIDVQAGDWIRITATAEGSPTRPSAHVSPAIAYVVAEEPDPEPEPKPEPSDKAALQAEIAKADGLDEAGYTAESWVDYQTALARAREVNDDADATQDEVDEARTALADAYDGLTEKEPEPKPDPDPDPEPTPADKTALQTAYDEAVKLSDGSSYTDESWAAFIAARDAAASVLGKDDATQNEVDAALQTLDDASRNLVEKEPTPDPDPDPDPDPTPDPDPGPEPEPDPTPDPTPTPDPGTQPGTDPTTKPDTGKKPESGRKPVIGSTGSAVTAVAATALAAAAVGAGIVIARRRRNG